MSRKPLLDSRMLKNQTRTEHPQSQSRAENPRNDKDLMNSMRRKVLRTPRALLTKSTIERRILAKLEESVDDPVARDAIEQFAHPNEAGTSARPAKGGYSAVWREKFIS